MNRIEDTTIEAVLEHLIADGAGGIGPAFTRMFELAMRLERERYLGAGHYERSGDRRGYANGYKPKRLDTPAGTLMVQVPKTAGHEDEPFYPQSLERGQRSVRAVMLAVAEMYVKGVSTREVEAILRQFGIEGLSSTQVSRAAKQLDVELEQWRNRPLGEVRYLILDARYERMRHDGIVRDVAVLSAIGVGPDERLRVLGVSVALSEAEVPSRAFLDSLGTDGQVAPGSRENRTFFSGRTNLLPDWSGKERLNAPARENPVAQCRPTRQPCLRSAFSWGLSGKCRLKRAMEPIGYAAGRVMRRLIKPMIKTATPSSIPRRPGTTESIIAQCICSVAYWLKPHGEVSPSQPPHCPE